MLQAGVIGCGHLGKFHIKQLSESKRYQLSGVYDKDLDIARVVSKEFNCDFFDIKDTYLRKVKADPNDFKNVILNQFNKNDFMKYY